MDLPDKRSEDEYFLEPAPSQGLENELTVFRTHGKTLVVFFILILLTSTFFAWFYTRKTVDNLAFAKFEKTVEETRLLISDRISVYLQVLYGEEAFFAASDLVERDEFATYIQKQNLFARYPGILALRYAERVSQKDKSAFIKSVRSDISLLPEGYPEFNIFPEGERPEYYVIKYLEPYKGYETRLGYDVKTEPIRLAALEKARDSGEPAVTGRLTLTTQAGEEIGFIIFLPVYRNGAPISTIEERRAALAGFVNVLFRTDDLLSGIFGKKSIHPEINFQIYDSDVCDQEHLLYDDEKVLSAVYPSFRPRFTSQRSIKIADKPFTLRFTALPDFGLSPTEEKLPLIVLSGGLLFSFLLFGILYIFATSRAQAILLAKELAGKFQESQRQYADLVEGAPDPIITLDRLGRLKSMNPAAERISGYTAQDLLGKYFANAQVLTIPSLNRALQEFAYSVVGKDRPPFELELIKKDNAVITVEANPRPIKQQGKTVALQVIFRDVTERKRVERALKEFSTYLDKIINAVADPIFVKDRKHHWVLLNDAYCHFMGYKREDLIGRSDYDFFPKEEADVFWEKDEFVFETGTENLNEEKFTDASKVTHLILTKKTLYVDMKGEKFIVGIIRDITDQKRVEEKIRQLNDDLERRNNELSAINKELEAFSYSVSHDLRAPLRAISGFSNALLEDCMARLDTQGQRYIHLIITNARNMGKLIDDLLTFSRLGRKPIDLANVNMSELAQEVFSELKQLVPGRDIDFRIQPLYPARSDQTLMRQVVTNLISNAIKFTARRDDAVVEMGSYIEGDEVIYYVRDNGVGFDPKYISKLFGVFQRLHSVEEFEGTGVGLAIVQRIVYRHGGRVWAEGKPGEGAAFYFALPHTLEGEKI